MIAPRNLSKGDKVAIVGTARKVTPDDMESAVRTLAGWGLDVMVSPLLYRGDHSYLAGTDEQRIAAVQQCLDDPAIRAIFCARGGYGTTRIIDGLDFRQFQEFPKWLIGFSDITALHLKASAIGIESIHGIMPILFKREDAVSSIESLHSVLFGENPSYLLNSSSRNRQGIGRGQLIGGNLSLIVDSFGTSYSLNAEGKILVLEEVDEYLYKVDRMMVQLKRSGVLGKLAGLVIGHFTDIKDTELTFGESIEDIVQYHTKEYSYPIAFNFQSGHSHPNLSWIEGRTATLEVKATRTLLKHHSANQA